MSYVINIKSHIKQGFTLSLENTASEKPRSGAGEGGRGEGGGEGEGSNWSSTLFNKNIKNYRSDLENVTIVTRGSWDFQQRLVSSIANVGKSFKDCKKLNRNKKNFDQKSNSLDKSSIFVTIKLGSKHK